MSQQNNGAMNVFIGMMTVVIGHAILLMLLYLLTLTQALGYTAGILFLYVFFGIGLAQLIYVVPLCLWLQRRDRTDTFKGVLLAAVITLLLNGGCFVWFFTIGGF